MYHVGVDIGSRKTHFCIAKSHGETVMQNTLKTTWLPRFFKELAEDKGACRIVLESCAQAFTIGSWAQDAGHDVRIVPSTFAKSLGIGEHGIKTDKRDAHALCQASCRVELRSIHIRSVESRQRLSATTARRTLINSRTMVINSVRGWLRTLVLHPPSGISKTFGKRVRETIAAANKELPGFIDSQLLVIDSLTEQIGEITKQLNTIANNDSVCQLLMSHPGVGPLTALEFKATIDDPGRFKHSDRIASYLGVTPGENSSSTRTRRTSITKFGSPEMRRLLCQAAWGFWRTQPETNTGKWVVAVAERRGKKIAMVGLMRKISVTLWSMWRKNEPYQSTSEDSSQQATVTSEEELAVA